MKFLTSGIIFFIIFQISDLYKLEKPILQLPSEVIKGDNVTISCEYNVKDDHEFFVSITRSDKSIFSLSFYKQNNTNQIEAEIIGKNKDVSILENKLFRTSIVLNNITKRCTGKFQCLIFVFGVGPMYSKSEFLQVKESETRTKSSMEILSENLSFPISGDVKELKEYMKNAEVINQYYKENECNIVEEPVTYRPSTTLDDFMARILVTENTSKLEETIAKHLAVRREARQNLDAENDYSEYDHDFSNYDADDYQNPYVDVDIPTEIPSSEESFNTWTPTPISEEGIKSFSEDIDNIYRSSSSSSSSSSPSSSEKEEIITTTTRHYEPVAVEESFTTEQNTFLFQNDSQGIEQNEHDFTINSANSVFDIMSFLCILISFYLFHIF